MDVQNPPSNSEDAPAANPAVVAETDAVPVVPQSVDALKDLESSADSNATPAVATDRSDAVISSSDPPIAHNENVNKEQSSEAPAPVEPVLDAVPAVKTVPDVNDADQLDEAAKSEVAQSDDDLMREMEAMEGDKKIDEVHIAEASKSEVGVGQNTVDESEGTSDLLKVLENDASDVTASLEASFSNIAGAKSVSAEASCVDSTTKSAKKLNTSATGSVITRENVVVPTNAVSEEEEEAMEVDDQPEESSVTEPESIDKDEAISSTSSDDARAMAEDVTNIEDTKSHKEDDSAASTAKILKEEAVTSSKDLPDAVSNEADSSEVSPHVSAPVESESSAIATHSSDSRPSETTSTPDELDRTLESAHGSSTARAENKLLTNMMNQGNSTPNSNPVSAAATPNVFNSTPISKQFEISSENVSKIDEHSTCDKTGAGLASNDVSTQDEIKSSDALTTFSGTDSTEPQSSDNLTHFANVIKKYNGLGSDSLVPVSTSVMSPLVIKSDSTNTNTVNLVALSNGNLIDDSTAQRLHGNEYEISVWYEESEMQYLSIECLAKKPAAGHSTLDTSAASSSSDKTSTTNGSVTSVGPFTLRPTRDITVSSNSSTGSDTKFVIPSPPIQTPLVKQTVTGVVSLCNFMIEHFGKIKQQLGVEDANVDSGPSTPVAGRGGKAGTTKKNLSKTAAASPNVGTTPKTKRAGKRAATSDTEEEPTPKKSKAQKKEPEPEESPLYITVLARWTDKKYYAGHVTDSKPGGKYVVLFEDGASKTLPEEFIVFGGDNSELPLLDQPVHALVGGDTYEPGLVTEINTTGETILYTVIAESKTVTVSSSDLYLEEDQAKIIQNSVKPTTDLKSPETPSTKRSGRPTAKFGDSLAAAAKRGAASTKKTPAATTPEPSTSGAGARAGRRNKRNEPPVPMVRSFSESSELSDTTDTHQMPHSPESGLEAVDGVQPELQKTPRKAELNKIRIMSEYLGTDQTRTIEDVIGQVQINQKLFRNKHFLLTCTISSKKANTGVSSSTVQKDDQGKNVSFSKLPFVKEHLRQQILAGGGTVYNYFEDIPKDKYRMCKIVAAYPNSTAKYVQCMAANIGAISHEYIIQSCQKGKLTDMRRYQLPIGWSIVENRYVRWPNSGQRKSPFKNTLILVGSYSREFTEFWSRVCRLAGADVWLIKDASDIGVVAKGGFMLSDLEFCEESKVKADFFGIEIVSTVWVVESLVLGRPCPPNADEKLKKSYQDEDY